METAGGCGGGGGPAGPARDGAEWPRPGARARLCNLAKFPQFNGKDVEVLRYDPEKSRWKVLLANGGDVNVRMENLEPAPIALAAAAALSREGPARGGQPPLEVVQHLEECLEAGRLFELQVALQGLAAGAAPELRAGMSSRLAAGTHSEIVEGRLELVEVPGKGKGYLAAKPIGKGCAVLFDTAFCSGRIGPSAHKDMFRDCHLHRDKEFFNDKVLSLAVGASGEGQPRLTRILENNVHECSREPQRLALFAAAARFNHSCCPNAAVDATHAWCVVRALRDIPEGEEVCISYVPVSDCYEERRGSLAPKGFQCVCERCTAEAESDPQMRVPCKCGATSFSMEEKSPLRQRCKECAATFDREESLHHLRKVKDTNGFMRSPEASGVHPQELVKRLQALAEHVKAGASNGIPRIHTESMHLLNHLANLHLCVATSVPGADRAASVDAFYSCKTLAAEAFEEKHSRWTSQRDVDYFLLLDQVVACSLLSRERRAEWAEKLAEACTLRFGQAELPASLAAARPG